MRGGKDKGVNGGKDGGVNCAEDGEGVYGGKDKGWQGPVVRTKG